MSRSDMLRMAKPCALLGGFGGMLPREIFFKWCNLVRFGVYFDQILSLNFFLNYHFLYKKFRNCNFLYKRINILDTLLLWGNYSREEIFWKIYDWCVLVCVLKHSWIKNGYFHVEILLIIVARICWGVQGHIQNFENLVQFGVFWSIFWSDCVLKNFLKINIFLYKTYFLYKT